MQEQNKNKHEHQADFGVEENYDFDQYGYAYPNKQLSKGQKFAVAILAFFSFLLIIFQFANFKNDINKPFEYGDNNTETISKDATCSGPDCPNTIASLRAQDTDGDGLNDYDELNIYKTSPYLEDSDSDGFSDFEEIKNEKDPNCPSGRDCYDVDPLANTMAEDEVNLDIEHLQETFDQSTGVSPSLGEIPEGFKDIDAESLRALLLESGVEKEMLDQLSDEDLLSTFQEVLGNE